MTAFDYAVMALVGGSVVLGLARGFVREVCALVSWVLAFWAAREFGFAGARVMTAVFDDPRLQTLSGYALVFIGVMLLCSAVSALAAMMLSAAGLGLTDRVLGGIFGMVRGLLIALIGVLMCGLTGLPEQSWWQEARFAPPLETAVLATKPWLPDGLALRLRYPLR